MQIQLFFMHFITAYLLLFSGCNSTDATVKGTIINNGEESESSSSITIAIKETNSFAAIQDLIFDAELGLQSDVTYIMIGDSTRVYTYYNNIVNHSEAIFEEVNATLSNYNVASHLVAQGGLAFKTFLGEQYDASDTINFVNISEAIDKIPRDGSTTIVDMSLGANDFSRLNEYYQSISGWEPERIHDDLKDIMNKTIDTLLTAKPNLHIMLTSPNPMDWESGSAVYQGVYVEVAAERQLPFANFVDEIMPAHSTEAFYTWYNDNIHFNQTIGLPAVSSFILKKILPTP